MPVALTQSQKAEIEAHYERHREELARREAERHELVARCEYDPVERAICLDRLSRESDDGDADIFFINNFCWTHDPRPDPFVQDKIIGDIPFLLDAEQEELIREYNRLERQPGKKTLHVVKSRDRGGTWIVLVALQARRWLFRDHHIALVGTITEDDIDKQGDQKSLFWKFDFIIDNLPAWMMPRGWEVNPRRSRARMNRVNPQKPTCIYKGDTVTAKWGGGDRCTVALMDECQDCGGDGTPDVAKTGFEKTNFTTEFRVLVGTPPKSGMSHWWSRMVEPEPGEDANPLLNRFDLCWENDPRHNACVRLANGMLHYPWYQSECDNPENSAEMIARELDRNFRVSLVGAVYPQVARTRSAFFDYDPMLPLYLTMDPGGGDQFALAWIQYDHTRGQFRVLQTYSNSRKLARFYLALIFGPVFREFLEDGYKPNPVPPEDLEIMERVEDWQYAGFYADPAGRNTDWLTSGVSAFDELRDKSRERSPHRYMDYIEYSIKEGKDHETRQRRLRWMLPRMVTHRLWAGDAIRSIAACRYPKKNESSTSTARPTGAPMHHTPGRDLVTALEYFAVSPLVKQIMDTPSVPLYVETEQSKVFSWGGDGHDPAGYGDKVIALPNGEELVLEPDDYAERNLYNALGRSRFSSSRRRWRR